MTGGEEPIRALTFHIAVNTYFNLQLLKFYVSYLPFFKTFHLDSLKNLNKLLRGAECAICGESKFYRICAGIAGAAEGKSFLSHK